MGVPLRAVDHLTTILFVPGTRPDRFAKALASGADAVCIDLEDSVPAEGKAAARAAVTGGIGADYALRINGLTTRAGLADLLALSEAEVVPRLLLVPKVESAAEIAIVRAILGSRAPAIVPLIETARGLRLAHEIAAAPGVAAMMFGGGDLSAELGVALAWDPLAHVRAAFVLVCAEAQIPAIDVPWIALDDEAGLAAETRAAKALGFAAKAAIHPAQIDVIAAILRPTDDEIDEARAALAAFDAAGGAAVRFNGRMLEAPIVRRYRRIVNNAES
jgi:(S)-citramalyl-CoA lyase